MGITGNVSEISVNVECEECGSNDIVECDDPNNQDMRRTFSGLIEDGWIFKMDSRWSDEYYQEHGKRPGTIWRGIHAFCCYECYENYLASNGEGDNEYINADLGYYCFEEFDENMELRR